MQIVVVLEPSKTLHVLTYTKHTGNVYVICLAIYDLKYKGCILRFNFEDFYFTFIWILNRFHTSMVDILHTMY